ncbi:MAG: hypothetical protein JST10_06790 [Bacteroidetes bacterium]|nr:hypothetical protein [Bacteroidota bacterium]MBS1632265.1 hypothetical protein [Bacteroidota bacterium]
MKKPFLKQLLIWLIAPAFLLSFTTKPDHANFSGDWNLNTGKSELGQFADFATRIIKSTQSSDSISIARTSTSMEGEDITTNETLTFDGKESNSKLNGQSTKKSSLKWADDGQSFSITYQLSLDFGGQQMDISGTEKWSLADNGKTLVVENNSSSSFGDMYTKSVYDKQ